MAWPDDLHEKIRQLQSERDELYDQHTALRDKLRTFLLDEATIIDLGKVGVDEALRQFNLQPRVEYVHLHVHIELPAESVDEQLVPFVRRAVESELPGAKVTVEDDEPHRFPPGVTAEEGGRHLGENLRQMLTTPQVVEDSRDPELQSYIADRVNSDDGVDLSHIREP